MLRLILTGILQDVVSVYSTFGPFHRWLRSEPEHPNIDPKAATDMIQKSLYDAMKEDDHRGGFGEWAGLLGFSQGAKICASLLLQQQVGSELGIDQTQTTYRFAILLAGRGPLISLDPQMVMNEALVDASEIGSLRVPAGGFVGNQEHVLRLPTVHVHGMRDPGLKLHRQLLEHYCEMESVRLVEWDGSHRVPIKSKDVAAVVKQILDVAQMAGY